MPNMSRYSKNQIFVAELIGTFALVLVGCGAIIVNGIDGSLSHLGVSLAFGLVVLAMIYSIGNISGAHINPAVSLGFWMSGRLPAKRLPIYLLAQLLGAVLAGMMLRLAFGEGDLGATNPGENIWLALAIEIVITFLLMFVILNVSTGHKEKGVMAGVAVGGSVAMLALVAGPLTGASMNPARSLGPALAAMELNTLWLYFLGPILGALAAAPFCRWVQGPECCVEENDA